MSSPPANRVMRLAVASVETMPPPPSGRMRSVAPGPDGDLDVVSDAAIDGEDIHRLTGAPQPTSSPISRKTRARYTR